MNADLAMLEERVRATVERLRVLDADRARLTDELDGLRRQMSNLREENKKLSGGLSETERATRIRRVEAALSETIEALRETTESARSSGRSGPA